MYMVLWNSIWKRYTYMKRDAIWQVRREAEKEREKERKSACTLKQTYYLFIAWLPFHMRAHRQVLATTMTATTKDDRKNECLRCPLFLSGSDEVRHAKEGWNTHSYTTNPKKESVPKQKLRNATWHVFARKENNWSILYYVHTHMIFKKHLYTCIAYVYICTFRARAYTHRKQMSF